MTQESIIERSYLPGLIFAALGIVVFGITVSALLLYLDIYHPLDTHYRAVLSIITDVRETLIFKTLKISVISSLLIIFGLTALVIFYTHRIAGPLHRIKICAKSIGEGRLGTKVKFRRRDVIHPFAETLNEMTDCYSEKVRTLTLEVRELKRTVAGLKSLAEDGKDTGEEGKKLLDKDSQIKSLLDTIKI